MPLTSAQRAALVEDFNSEQFAPLDLSNYPNFAQPPEQTRDDGRFAKHWTDTPLNTSAAALRAFVSDPDTAALDRAGQETGHEDLVDEVRQRKGELVAQKFKQARPSYVPCDDNLDALTEMMAFNYLPSSERNGDTKELIDRLIDARVWDVTHLCAAYDVLENEGIMVRAAGEAHNLSSAERLRVTRLAQAGNLDAAIGEYLRCALDGEEPDMQMVNDPAYLGVCNEAVYSVFSDTQLDYAPTPEHEAYLSRYAGSRPLTLELLRQAWRSCQQKEHRHERSELLSPLREQDQPPSGRNLNALNDDEVDRLYRASLREYAKSLRAAGMLA